MGTPIRTAPVFTPSSPLMVPLAHSGFFNISACFIPDTSLGMPHVHDPDQHGGAHADSRCYKCRWIGSGRVCCASGIATASIVHLATSFPTATRWSPVTSIGLAADGLVSTTGGWLLARCIGSSADGEPCNTTRRLPTTGIGPSAHSLSALAPVQQQQPTVQQQNDNCRCITGKPT
jgi:hypothetical protein